MKDNLLIAFAIVLGLITAVGAALWTVLLLVLQILFNNFKWLLLSATALTLGYWYL